ncbi:hypothetical protein QBC47DRAFT_338113 [Echria macrotheca]|uniref:DUF2461 domain-containing protein n=1 Tax=Echria macrotheca TaxID=438768 RepID=A0AAJ0BMV7_9PEZI|nr:hypothetical protein QBC47DRAFT_338113 [Echria macrotheca]
MAARKRKSAAAATPAAVKEETTSSRRRSQRVSSSATKKSLYFEDDSDSDVAQQPAKKAKRQSASGQQKKTKKRPVVDSESDGDKYEDDDDDEADPEDDDVEDEDEDDDEPPKKKRGKHQKVKVVESESEVDEDAPPKVTFIPLPKLRDTDGVDYADDKLHKNTLAFLKDLKANNRRNWLKSHDAEYRRSLKDWESYVTTMTEKIIEVDETIPELPFKDINFRIYRDIRFSNDPTPYKAHYAAAWSRTGRKGPYACYYIHVEPGASFLGGGLWHPDGESVQRLRASIDERPARWRRALCDPTFQRVFLPDVVVPKKKGRQDTNKEYEKACLKAFCAKNAEGALKTRPKGYAAEHRDIELLKLRNYTVSRRLDEDVFLREGGQDELVGMVRALAGFVAHLNRIVRPDPGDDDDSEEGEGGGEGEE